MKVLHQVWVQGEDNLPSEYAENRRKWVELLAPRGWTFKLWDNRSACGQWKDYAEHEASCYHHATRCDLILARALRGSGTKTIRS